MPEPQTPENLPPLVPADNEIATAYITASWDQARATALARSLQEDQTKYSQAGADKYAEYAKLKASNPDEAKNFMEYNLNISFPFQGELYHLLKRESDIQNLDAQNITVQANEIDNQLNIAARQLATQRGAATAALNAGDIPTAVTLLNHQIELLEQPDTFELFEKQITSTLDHDPQLLTHFANPDFLKTLQSIEGLGLMPPHIPVLATPDHQEAFSRLRRYYYLAKGIQLSQSNHPDGDILTEYNLRNANGLAEQTLEETTIRPLEGNDTSDPAEGHLGKKEFVTILHQQIYPKIDNDPLEQLQPHERPGLILAHLINHPDFVKLHPRVQEETKLMAAGFALDTLNYSFPNNTDNADTTKGRLECAVIILQAAIGPDQLLPLSQSDLPRSPDPNSVSEFIGRQLVKELSNMDSTQPLKSKTFKELALKSNLKITDAKAVAQAQIAAAEAQAAQAHAEAQAAQTATEAARQAKLDTHTKLSQLTPDELKKIAEDPSDPNHQQALGALTEYGSTVKNLQTETKGGIFGIGAKTIISSSETFRLETELAALKASEAYQNAETPALTRELALNLALKYIRSLK